MNVSDFLLGWIVTAVRHVIFINERVDAKIRLQNYLYFKIYSALCVYIDLIAGETWKFRMMTDPFFEIDV